MFPCISTRNLTPTYNLELNSEPENGSKCGRIRIEVKVYLHCHSDIAIQTDSDSECHTYQFLD